MLIEFFPIKRINQTKLFLSTLVQNYKQITHLNYHFETTGFREKWLTYVEKVVTQKSPLDIS